MAKSDITPNSPTTAHLTSHLKTACSKAQSPTMIKKVQFEVPLGISPTNTDDTLSVQPDESHKEGYRLTPHPVSGRRLNSPTSISTEKFEIDSTNSGSDSNSNSSTTSVSSSNISTSGAQTEALPVFKENMTELDQYMKVGQMGLAEQRGLGSKKAAKSALESLDSPSGSSSSPTKAPTHDDHSNSTEHPTGLSGEGSDVVS